MPTRYRRVGVPLDSELDDALRRSAPQLRSSSQAARLRELALLGARSIGTSTARLRETTAALDELGATPARGDLIAASRRLLRRHPTPPARESASDSLRWARRTR
ncbi:MAG: hypothetical protein ACYCUM_05625 [Solirubrobacteraceae bacterium]